MKTEQNSIKKEKEKITLERDTLSEKLREEKLKVKKLKEDIDVVNSEKSKIKEKLLDLKKAYETVKSD